MDRILVELVKVGFHGAAIAMAFYSYKLIDRAIASKGKAECPETLRTIRFYTKVCLALLIVGVCAQLAAPLMPHIYKPVAKIFLQPAHWPDSITDWRNHVSVIHERKDLNMANGSAEVSIDNKDSLCVNMEKLVYKIEVLDSNYKLLLAQRTPGGGYAK